MEKYLPENFDLSGSSLLTQKHPLSCSEVSVERDMCTRMQANMCACPTCSWEECREETVPQAGSLALPLTVDQPGRNELFTSLGGNVRE